LAHPVSRIKKSRWPAKLAVGIFHDLHFDQAGRSMRFQALIVPRTASGRQPNALQTSLDIFSRFAVAFRSMIDKKVESKMSSRRARSKLISYTPVEFRVRVRLSPRRRASTSDLNPMGWSPTASVGQHQ
jgi:hypothetical protein